MYFLNHADEVTCSYVHAKVIVRPYLIVVDLNSTQYNCPEATVLMLNAYIVKLKFWPINNVCRWLRPYCTHTKTSS